MSQDTLVKRQYGHRARLALSPMQVAKFDGQGHAARALWNLLHEWWTMVGQNRRLDLKDADTAIRQARADIDFLSVLPAQAAQAVLKTYHRAWRNCWDGRVKKPVFKFRIRSTMSVDVPQGRNLNVVRVHRRWGMVNVPKVGRVRFRWTRDLPVGKHANAENRITGARLVKDALGWHIAFRVQALESAPGSHRGAEVGIDVGVTIPLALSDGNHQDHGRLTKTESGKADRDKWLDSKEKAKLLRLERQAAQRKQHCEPGQSVSRRLHHTYDQIRGLRARATRRHQDWQHKTTTALAQQYATVVVEQLAITNMTRSAKGTVAEPGRNVAQKAGLNRAISQEAWGQTVTMLAYKLAQRGGTLVKVPAPGTSQRCSECGFTTPGSRMSQATFVCKKAGCGFTANADWNAARNVLHLYRIGLVAVPAAGRAVVRRVRRVKPATAR